MAKRSLGKSIARRRIYLVEDHPTFREGLAQILDEERDLTICGAAGTAKKAVPAIARLKPDLVLVDITLPGKSGLELIREVRKTNRKVKLLVLSMHDEALYADRVLRAGGDGYIMKQEDPSEIVHAICDVLAGHIYVSEEVLAAGTKASPKRSLKAKIRPFDQLTDREVQVLDLIGRGKSNPAIARQLGTSRAAAASQATQIKKKLRLKSDRALIRYAVCWVETGAT